MIDHFLALDVETANPDLSSICQIGIVTFDGCDVTARWQTYVDPQDYFFVWNVGIHGITENMVQGAPTFVQLFPELCARLADQIVIHHTHFDRVAFAKAQEKYGLGPLGCTWLDSAKIVRRTWPQFSQSGYGLASVAEKLGITYQAHAAVEDAYAAGKVVVRAIAQSGLTLADWLIRVTQPIKPPTRSVVKSSSNERRLLARGEANESVDQPFSATIVRDGNPNGPLFGEVVAFSGVRSLPSLEAADLAAQAGCTVTVAVSKHTTLLVVGDQDMQRLAGDVKSLKLRKAEELIRNGQPIRILGERDFLCLIGISL